MDPKINDASRRPLAVRQSALTQRIAVWINNHDITPNQISLMSIVFAALGFAAMLGYHYFASSVLLLVTAVCIQGRLLCNLFDGMVAIEGGKSTASGELFNDVPDRIADPLLIIGVGFATVHEGGMYLAWACALVAVLTAYIRVLGVSMGTKADFRGPMAKQHRMALLTGALVVLFLQNLTGFFAGLPVNIIELALVVMLLGSLVTCWRRLVFIYQDVEGAALKEGDKQ
ncbi:CDP-alcohol phosphatidyltransferase family protein [Enterovibrio norvegicus]|uniref:CDP-alcohol phosphatidyltransferase family protein n=1 Tax=Enterovibrio norvegicus TaxID=188144 RepID=UPI000C820B79|nr:CDP-alcohol phosphatidyltransferase family protein [Enterovibrio norvegicus]PML82000.1 CDP-diacylglycerol--glycerol-3-phosphate 3-phosphatidyltransferase [Enterovibrio norvegicus]